MGHPSALWPHGHERIVDGCTEARRCRHSSTAQYPSRLLFVLDLAGNKDVVFRLGWHVLRNRDDDSRDSSVEERDEK